MTDEYTVYRHNMILITQKLYSFDKITGMEIHIWKNCFVLPQYTSKMIKKSEYLKMKSLRR